MERKPKMDRYEHTKAAFDSTIGVTEIEQFDKAKYSVELLDEIILDFRSMMEFLKVNYNRSFCSKLVGRLYNPYKESEEDVKIYIVKGGEWINIVDEHFLLIFEDMFKDRNLINRDIFDSKLSLIKRDLASKITNQMMEKLKESCQEKK